MQLTTVLNDAINLEQSTHKVYDLVRRNSDSLALDRTTAYETWQSAVRLVRHVREAMTSQYDEAECEAHKLNVPELRTNMWDSHEVKSTYVNPFSSDPNGYGDGYDTTEHEVNRGAW